MTAWFLQARFNSKYSKYIDYAVGNPTKSR